MDIELRFLQRDSLRLQRDLEDAKGWAKNLEIALRDILISQAISAGAKTTYAEVMANMKITAAKTAFFEGEYNKRKEAKSRDQ